MSGEREFVEHAPSEFEQTGGEVFAYLEDGSPARWKCGRGLHGEKVDPPGLNGHQVWYELSHEGYWEGLVPTDQDMAEEDAWQDGHAL